MANYRRNDRKIDTIRKRNCTLANRISKELSTTRNNFVIDNCFDEIKKNQIEIQRLVRKNSLRRNAISRNYKRYYF